MISMIGMMLSKVGRQTKFSMMGTAIPKYNSIHNKRFHKQLLSGAREMGTLVVDPVDVPEIKEAYKVDPWFCDFANVDTLKEVNGLYWKGTHLSIPNNEGIKDKILAACHDSLCAGHLGKTKTYDLVARQYWWPGLRKDVNKHCMTCDSCQRIRQNNQKYGGLLQPLPIPEKQWQTVTMDLIVALPRTLDGNTSLVVFVDKLTKMIHIAPCVGVSSAPALADLFLKNVFRYHGMPTRFVSDRDPRFNSDFWKEFFDQCKVSCKMSSAFHPETDGQTEIVNKCIENYLRHFVAENQDDWDKLLLFAEIAYNNSIHESTGSTPFRLNSGFDPNLPSSFKVYEEQYPIEPRKPGSTRRGGKCPRAQEYFKRIQLAIVEARINLEAAQQRQKAYADTKRREVKFKVGDVVLVSTQNLSLKKGSTRKLLHRFMGPFSVIKEINPVTMEIDLPNKLRMHNVFHVSLLRPYIEGKSPRSPPIPVVLKGEHEFVVHKILKHDMVKVSSKKTQLECLIKWKGYTDEHNTWEIMDSLHNCPEIVAEYKKTHKL